LVPFLDLKAQYRGIKTEIDAAVLAVLDSTQYVLGQYVAEFEKAFANYCSAAKGIAVNSGTSALHIALLAAGVGEGGLVTTSNPEYEHKLRMLRDWGAERKYHHEIKGFNYRMEGLQGAILGVKLRHLEAWTEARRRRARQYI